MFALNAQYSKRVSGRPRSCRQKDPREHPSEGDKADGCPFLARSESRVRRRSRLGIGRCRGRYRGSFANLGLEAGVDGEVFKGRKEVVVMTNGEIFLAGGGRGFV